MVSLWLVIPLLALQPQALPEARPHLGLSYGSGAVGHELYLPGYVCLHVGCE